MSCPACIELAEPFPTYCGRCGARLAARDRLVGTLLDERYRIDAEIAAGGFGTIYRATTVATGQQVAIKILHARHTTDPSVSARFRRESTAMSSLRNPHTIATYEAGEDHDETRFIVMELLHGETLAARFALRGALGWRAVLSIVRAACSSLEEAHATGIVHRDLKPANIFLAEHPRPDFVKVSDFGIAKIVRGSAIDDGSELTRVGEALGTLEYMSPEQLVGGEIDRRTDIYTLGVVAYEMIAGRRPFAEATSAPGLVTALMTRSPPPPSAFVQGPLPRELDGVLLRCLERDPHDRYGDVTQLAAAIDRMLKTHLENVTTQQRWHPSPRGDADEEITLVDPPSPFDREPNTSAPAAAFESVVRAQVLAAELPHPWRAAGTGTLDRTGPSVRPSSVAVAVPVAQIAIGSSPIVVASRSEFARMFVIALILVLIGFAIGLSLATFAT